MTMSYKHKSGAQKRREKDERELKQKESSKGQLSLGHFFKSPLPSSDASVEVNSSSSSTKIIDVNLTLNKNELNEAVNNQPLPSSAASDVIELESNSSTNIQTESPQPTGKKVNENNTIEFKESKNIAGERHVGCGSVLVASHDDTRLQLSPCRYFDIGDPSFDPGDLKYPHIPLPDHFPEDSSGYSVPTSIFKRKLTNSELVTRDWLVWSRVNKAFYCLPCRIFSSLPLTQRSSLTLSQGFSTEKRWKKLFDKIPEHENSSSHKSCYIQWKSEIIKSKSDKSLSGLVLNCVRKKRTSGGIF